MARDLRMTNVKNEKFHAKIIKIAYFELQKSYIPQKKSENMYNKGSARKSKISCKKLYFFQFFSIFATYLRTPKIFNAQFSESSEKKNSKNDSAATFQISKGTKS